MNLTGELRTWLLSRRGMDDPAHRAQLLAMAAKLDGPTRHDDSRDAGDVPGDSAGDAAAFACKLPTLR